MAGVENESQKQGLQNVRQIADAVMLSAEQRGISPTIASLMQVYAYSLLPNIAFELTLLDRADRARVSQLLTPESLTVIDVIRQENDKVNSRIADEKGKTRRDDITTQKLELEAIQRERRALLDALQLDPEIANEAIGSLAVALGSWGNNRSSIAKPAIRAMQDTLRTGLREKGGFTALSLIAEPLQVLFRDIYESIEGSQPILSFANFVHSTVTDFYKREEAAA